MKAIRLLLISFFVLCVSTTNVAADSAIDQTYPEAQAEEVHAHVEGLAENVVGMSFTGPMKESTLQNHVRYDDLDLASDDGAETLRKRVQDEARKACADLDKRNSNLGRDLSCIAAANKSANLQVDYAIKLAVASKRALANK